MIPHSSLMQNGAPGHAAKITIQKISNQNVRVIRWLVLNPDFNLIETVWNNMKNWIQQNHFEILNYEQFRGVVIAIWDQIPVEFFNDLVDSMQTRCETVIRVNGMHMEY